MNSPIDEKFYILAGTSGEYTTARQKLGLVPKQAFWLTRPSLLKDLEAPKVYRYGSWKNLPKLEEIEFQIEASKATVSDID